VKVYVGTGFIRKGRLVVRHPQRYAEIFGGWRDGEVTITIEKKHAIRSQEASRYYFGVCLRLLSEHTGYSIDELHEWAKARFIPKHVALLDRNGSVVDDLVIGGTTTRLNRVQFYEFVEALRQFAAEKLDLAIPDPDPHYRDRAA
jgi:hypothetical protein